jgi:hypothetical protein
MGEKFSAVARAVRTFVQGALATGFLAAAEALHTGLTSGQFNMRFVVTGVITAFVGAIMTYVFNVVAPRTGVAPAGVEGLIAFVRTAIQTLAAVGIIAAWDAVYALMTAGNFVPGDLWKAALAAGTTAGVAALHNMLDAKNRRSTLRGRLAE